MIFTETVRKILICITLVVLPSSGYTGESTIEVSGSAKESIIPDLARLSFTINARGKELAALKTEVDGKTAALVRLCKKLGISKKDISSAEVTIYPQYNHQTKELVAYAVSRTVKITLRELSKYTEMMNGAIATGVNTVGGLVLDVKDRDVLQEKSLAAAVNNARTKAEVLAASAGVSVGGVISISETSSSPGVEPYRFVERAASASGQGAFEPGEITLTTSVLVKYRIE